MYFDKPFLCNSTQNVDHAEPMIDVISEDRFMGLWFNIAAIIYN